VQTFRREHGLPERFILHVGTLQPRKNLVRLVQATSRSGTTRPPSWPIHPSMRGLAFLW
jgi:hypothetical protein